MRIFRLYMLIGGMPQAVETYLEQNNLQAVDEVKREMPNLNQALRQPVFKGLRDDVSPMDVQIV